MGVTTFGGPDALEIVDVPEPHAGPGEVRVRVHAATVNPGDTLLRAGAMPLPDSTPPYVPGMEVGGVVDEIGPALDGGPATEGRLEIGDRVMAMVKPIRPEGGAYAEYVVLPASWVGGAPAGSSHAEAATLPMNGLTARLTLDLLALAPGQTLAVTGAAGAVGGYVVQLAKADGLRVIADASAADEALVRGLGADVVVARGDDVAGRLRQTAPEGVDAISDNAVIGVAALSDAIRDGGGIALVRTEDQPGMKPSGPPARGIVHHQVYVPDYGGDWGRLDRLRRQVESGAVTLRVARTFPAERAADAHRILEAGGVRGRLVIEF